MHRALLLPEMVFAICVYLDLVDLARFSRTCNVLYEMCWSLVWRNVDLGSFRMLGEGQASGHFDPTFVSQ